MPTRTEIGSTFARRRSSDQGATAPMIEAEHDAERGQHQDLEQVGLEHQRAGAPEHFSVAMVATLPSRIAADGVADADAADQQGRQARPASGTASGDR